LDKTLYFSLLQRIWPDWPYITWVILYILRSGSQAHLCILKYIKTFNKRIFAKVKSLSHKKWEWPERERPFEKKCVSVFYDINVLACIDYSAFQWKETRDLFDAIERLIINLKSSNADVRDYYEQTGNIVQFTNTKKKWELDRKLQLPISIKSLRFSLAQDTDFPWIANFAEKIFTQLPA